jgi:hypothetical protein
MGTHGTAAAHAIKAAEGLCIAQDPEKAEFSGMSRSEIHGGFADQVLPAREIPNLLLLVADYPRGRVEVDLHLGSQLHSFKQRRASVGLSAYEEISGDVFKGGSSESSPARARPGEDGAQKN